ncbi:MAG: exodeoxyribonuclease III [Cardiobacteriaceae bacterium]|nr:exodeoxyribonuclease III [Cardiobacteriaceae bacterium]
MKIASWNVNSLKIRQNQVLSFLEKENPDILVLQEIKQTDDAVNIEEFKNNNWNIELFGQKTYNGVAIISKYQINNPLRGIKNYSDSQSRFISAEIENTLIICVYVPNGQEVACEKYFYKLAWLENFANYLADLRKTYPRIAILGDFNIAPADIDIYAAEKWQGKILCSDAERAAMQKIFDLGFYDSFRRENPDAREFSWWDYRAAAFQKNLGVRIDLALVSDGINAKNCRICREYRGLERPSDHAPIWLEIE